MNIGRFPTNPFRAPDANPPAAPIALPHPITTRIIARQAEVLLFDHHLAVGLRSLLEQAVSAAEMQLHAWHPGDELDARRRPVVIIAALVRGSRRLPPAVAHLAEEVFPGVAVLLLSEEILVQPWILLHGGRVTMVGAPMTADVLTARIQAAVQWRPLPATAAVTASATATNPALIAAPQRSELSNGRGRAYRVVFNERQAPRLELSQALGLTVLASPASAVGIPPRSLERDLIPSLDAWQDRPDSEHLSRALDMADGSALAHLDTNACRWLVVSSTAVTVALASPQRLPGWWDFARDGNPRVRAVMAEPGDVLIVASGLPAQGDCAPARLAALAARGARAVAEHLTTARLGSTDSGAIAVMELLP